MYTQDRSQLRKLFFKSWKKSQQQEQLSAMEQIIVTIIKLHPEYHAMLEHENDTIDKDYSPENGESNPFLHMAMHISIHEQIATNRPTQISNLYQQLLLKYQDPHALEHQMMECLGQMIWQAQRDNMEPDESSYLECLHNLI